MAEWADGEREIEACWPIARRDARARALGIEFGGRRFRLVVSAQRDRPAVAVDLFGYDLLQPRLALRYDASAGRGALAVECGRYVPRQVLPLDGLAAEQVSGTVRAAVIEAARRHRAFAPETPALDLRRAAFANLCDQAKGERAQ